MTTGGSSSSSNMIASLDRVIIILPCVHQTVVVTERGDGEKKEPWRLFLLRGVTGTEGHRGMSDPSSS